MNENSGRAELKSLQVSPVNTGSNSQVPLKRKHRLYKVYTCRISSLRIFTFESGRGFFTSRPASGDLPVITRVSSSRRVLSSNHPASCLGGPDRPPDRQAERVRRAERLRIEVWFRRFGRSGGAV